MKLTRRKLELLQICSKAFHRYGYAGATMKILAEAAGLEPASFYSHFQSKEEILEFITEGAIQSLNRELESITINESKSNLEVLFDAVISYAINEPFSFAVLHRNINYLEKEGESKQLESYQDLNEKIKKLLIREISSWNSKHVDPQVALTIMNNAISTLADIENDQERLEDASEIIKEIYLHGLKQ